MSSASSYLMFKVGDALFAIAIARVREVLEVSTTTQVPAAPASMRGIVNVRGAAIPVFELRAKLGLPAAADTVHSRIIVLELELEGEAVALGGLADSVHEVVELHGAELVAPPHVGFVGRADIVEGLARRGDDFVMILDAAAVFADDHAALAASVS